MHIPSHFSQKIAWVNDDFSSVTTYKDKNSTMDPFVRDVIGFFETASPVHYSLMATTFVVIVVLAILCCCSVYMSCPSLLVKLLCCCNNRCNLKQRVQNRVEYCENVRQQPTVTFSMSRDQPVSGASQDPDIETSFMLHPKHPEHQIMHQVQPIIKDQAPPATLHSSLCARGFRGCSCLRDKHECSGPQGLPPAYGQLSTYKPV